MNDSWKNLTVSEITMAVYVAPNTGRHVHKNRHCHGLVMSDGEAVFEYCFDGGQIMRVSGQCIYYLPKGSSYYVRSIQAGGCYAINFDADISDVPFCVQIRGDGRLLHGFKAAVNAWKNRDGFGILETKRTVYDAVLQLQRELGRQYLQSKTLEKITPALERLNSSFNEEGLTVSHLSAICGMSEVYFRKIFLAHHGISPKEYIIQKRIEYSKNLLRSGDFTVSEIAAMCGYAEPCHFSREFSRREGMSPINYANMSKNK